MLLLPVLVYIHTHSGVFGKMTLSIPTGVDSIVLLEIRMIKQKVEAVLTCIEFEKITAVLRCLAELQPSGEVGHPPKPIRTQFGQAKVSAWLNDSGQRVERAKICLSHHTDDEQVVVWYDCAWGAGVRVTDREGNFLYDDCP